MLCLSNLGAKGRGLLSAQAYRMLIGAGDPMLCLSNFRACVENSRYTSTDSLRDTAAALGLERTDLHLTAKLVYMLFRLENATAYKAPDKVGVRRGLSGRPSADASVQGPAHRCPKLNL